MRREMCHRGQAETEVQVRSPRKRLHERHSQKIGMAGVTNQELRKS